MITKVKKRDGRIVDYDSSKIVNAILKAFKSLGMLEGKEVRLANKIEAKIKETAESIPEVEFIQDMIEKELMASNFKNVAKEFILYREKRNRERERDSALRKEILSKIECTNVMNQNANVDEESFGGRKFESAAVIHKDIALNDLMSSDVAKAHKEARIYIHDLDSYSVGMQNCLARETKFITDKGVKSFLDFQDGDVVNVLTPNGEYKKAIVRSFGKQLLYEIVFTRNKGKQIVHATQNHRWLLKDGSVTSNLAVGDSLLRPPTFSIFDFELANEEEKYYWCLGFVLGDGCNNHRWSRGKKIEDKRFVRLRLCGHKIKYADRFNALKHSKRLLENGDIELTFSSVIGFVKEVPNLESLTLKEMSALFDGLYCADGNRKGTNTMLLTTNKELISFIKNYCPCFGKYILREKDLTGQTTNFGIRGFTKQFSFISNNNVNYFTVESITPYREDVVWCLDVEEAHSFVLPNGIVTGNCLFADLVPLLTNGFITRNGDVRGAGSFSTACQLVAVIFQAQSQCQFGGIASAHIDRDLAPFVKKSFVKHFKNGMKYIEQKEIDKELEYFLGFLKNNEENIHIDNDVFKKYEKAYEYANDMLEREGKQSAEAMYHNLNTLESRPGSQLPFTSINYGLDITPEGRLVTKWLLNASIEGIGKNHLTPIFPISIFQYKKGVNDREGTPNYDLKKLAIKSLSKRIYPNIVNCDWSKNPASNIDEEMATMGKWNLAHLKPFERRQAV